MINKVPLRTPTKLGVMQNLGHATISSPIEAGEISNDAACEMRNGRSPLSAIKGTPVYDPEVVLIGSIAGRPLESVSIAY